MKLFKIETNRLLLRQAKRTDANSIFAYRQDAETNKYQGFIPTSLHQVEQFIGKTETINTPETWFQAVIIVKESNALVGDIGLHFIDDNQVEFGCTLAKTEQGKGYANESLNAVFDYLFNDLHKHRITASIDPRNLGSLKMVENLKMRKEAHFVKSYFTGGQWTDDVVYALLNEEFTQL